MSLKCLSTAGPIGMRRQVQPSLFISFSALLLVRPLVPKPGIVMAMMFSAGHCALS